jgi:hypothetical protein
MGTESEGGCAGWNGDLRRKEAAAQAKCPDLGVESYHAEICVSALTDATPRPDRH